jgi:short-subunit dehydrogenase
MASIVAVAPEMLNGVYGATKAFLLALSRSVHHEVSDKGVRIQVVLPNAIATELWDVAGTPIQSMGEERRQNVMPPEDMVDAALSGLDQGEFVTIPVLPDAADWDALEAARQKLRSNFSHAFPASRYKMNKGGAAERARA